MKESNCDFAVSLTMNDSDSGPGKERGGVGLSCLSGLSTAAISGVAIVLCCVCLVVLSACLISSAHLVHEGCVSVYFVNGALQDEYGEPGIRWARPFVTRVEEVKVRPETRFMEPMVCTTRDGVRNVFRDVQVITSISKQQVRCSIR